MKRLFLFIVISLCCVGTFAENGHALWLRMPANTKVAKITVVGAKNNAVLGTAKSELQRYWTGSPVRLVIDKTAPANDGYSIATTANETIITAAMNSGLLYGAYALLRGERNTSSTPTYALRILNHWDNPNATVERGFAGHSIFWNDSTQADLNIIREYGRANASIGINATVLNNVNAKPLMLSRAKLLETKRIADALRPYGIRVFLSVNFASPKALGGLATADPLDKDVQTWWQAKVKEIYKIIPDFGGFLVKANSEGEPGPGDYNRSHAEGANMLADALKPYNGLVMWRAFVYSSKASDRASQAYDEFVPLDGQFHDNIIIQVKNGPIDFQPREAVSPLFFGLKKTPLMPEFQITQEYTGESIHTCFLASMWREFFDTVSQYGGTAGEGGAIAGVANIGNSITWCGSDMAQANWYAFGRMAWDKTLQPEQIAREWLSQTYTSDSKFIEPMTRVLCQSREAVVHYMMPLGLHHIFAGGHHYGPEPWCNPPGWRVDWTPAYYHKADSVGLGFNRTTTGSNNVNQYPAALRDEYNDINRCPEQLLLWFHHASWNHRMHNGETLWNVLCHTYDQGVREAQAFAAVWDTMKPYVDSDRFAAQQTLFQRQAKDAQWWRDGCLLYFQQFSHQLFPLDSPATHYTLPQLLHYHLNIDNYTRAPLDKLPQ